MDKRPFFAPLSIDLDARIQLESPPFVMDVAVERPLPPPPAPAPVKEEEIRKPAEIGGAPPIVFESFATSTLRKDAITTNKQEEKLEATKAEMGEVREENERLKSLLSRVSRDYQSLQMHFLDVVKVKEQQQQAAAAAKLAAPAADDLVSLRLGTRPNNGSSYSSTTRLNGGGQERSLSSSSGTETDHEDQLSLRLRSRPSTNDDSDKQASCPPALAPVLSLSSDNSAEDVAADARKLPATSPPTNKARKTSSGGAGDVADDEVLQHQAKKARVSVRVKCDTPTMNDGCQWRKYGQKISKGNPCPRAYYRCTVAPSCPVRKQVQRCSDDMSILITTYEGTHSHPLPPAAAAMASTTSAAASMLLSGSSSSSQGHHHHHLPFATSAGLLGPTTISTAASCPTVTLDLTSPHSSLLQHQSAYAAAAAAAGGYESKSMPAAWSGGYLGYAGGQLPYYGKQPSAGHYGMAGIMSTRPEQLYAGAQSYLQRSSSGGVHGAPAVTDTIAKAITSDPSFQSVLAAAITSYMGRGAGAGAAAHK